MSEVADAETVFGDGRMIFLVGMCLLVGCVFFGLTVNEHFELHRSEAREQADGEDRDEGCDEIRFEFVHDVCFGKCRDGESEPGFSGACEWQWFGNTSEIQPA